MKNNQRKTTVYQYPCSSKTSCNSITETLKPGLYCFEVWGASGGTGAGNDTGHGGYAKGLIMLKEMSYPLVN